MAKSMDHEIYVTVTYKQNEVIGYVRLNKYPGMMPLYLLGSEIQGKVSGP